VEKILCDINNKLDRKDKEESAFKFKMESDIHIMSRQLSDNSDEINKLRFTEQEFRQSQHDIKFFKEKVNRMSLKMDTHEIKVYEIQRSFDKMASSIDSLKQNMDLKFETLIKGFDKMEAITEHSREEAIGQKKDIQNAVRQMEKMEDKVSGITKLEEKLLNAEKKIFSMPKGIVTCITLFLAVAAILANVLNTGGIK